jgi:hypothetical protein
MERRDFMKMMAWGTAGLAGMGTPSAFAGEHGRDNCKAKVRFSKQKLWARHNYKGMSTLLFPSFTPDFQAIDEEGVRLDVQNSIDHGFIGAMCFPVGVPISVLVRPGMIWNANGLDSLSLPPRPALKSWRKPF